MPSQDTTRAACLTPAGAGGIAVVQIIGRRAPAIISPHIKADRPLDLESLVPDRLRFCRITDGDETIDDAVVAAHRNDAGLLVVDVNLHGGPRVVQRFLLLLKRAGVEIVDARAFLHTQHQGRPTLEREIAEALLLVKTRPVAAWLARSIERIPAEIDAMLGNLQAKRIADVRSLLTIRLIEGERASYLLNGVRAVLVGRPNTGKSTLANRLAGRDLAVVSNQPGTTRDWTEHPGAIAGIPFTFVDTAGIRPTVDPIEREAIRRTHAQLAPADVAIRVMDVSRPPHDDDLRAIEASESAGPPSLLAWNKTDLGVHPDQAPVIERVRERSVVLSAETGQGLNDLRQGIVALLCLEGWDSAGAAPFTERQMITYRSALSALEADPQDAALAARWLKTVISMEPVEKDT